MKDCDTNSWMMSRCCERFLQISTEKEFWKNFKNTGLESIPLQQQWTHLNFCQQIRFRRFFFFRRTWWSCSNMKERSCASRPNLPSLSLKCLGCDIFFCPHHQGRSHTLRDPEKRKLSFTFHSTGADYYPNQNIWAVGRPGFSAIWFVSVTWWEPISFCLMRNVSQDADRVFVISFYLQDGPPPCEDAT